MELYEIYRTASNVRSAQKKINAPQEAEREFKEKSKPYRKSHKAAHEENLAKLRKEAESAEKKIASLRQEAEQNPETPLSRVIIHMTEPGKPEPDINKKPNPNPPPTSNPESPPPPPQKKFPPSNWTRKQRDVYWDIETIILDNPKLAGKALLDKIKEELLK